MSEYEALAALAEAATPGPWAFEGHDAEGEWEMWTEPLDADGFYVHIVEDDPDYPPLTVADGRFIAAARTAVPDLLRAIERVQLLAAEYDKGDDAERLLALQLRTAIAEVTP